ncbi:CRISPR-associated CARF protein Csx1 [Methanocaldococcus infernus]
MEVKATLLTPIFIGCGEDYSQLDYFFDGNIVKIVNLEKALTHLKDTKKIDELCKYIINNVERNRINITAKELLERVGLDPYEFVDMELESEIREDRRVRVKKFIKTNNQYYIPGSSIKGAIRTAYLFNYYKKHISELYEILNDKNISLDKKGKAIEERAIGKIKDDFFKYLKVSDSLYLDGEFKFINTRRWSYRRKRLEVPINLEAMTKGEFKFKLKIEKEFVEAVNKKLESNYKDGFQALKDICNNFSRTVVEFELKKEQPEELYDFYQKLLSDINKNDALYINLGFLGGFLNKTLYLLWKTDKNCLLSEKEPDLKVWKSAKNYLNFPTTKGVYVKNNRIVSPLGWIKVKRMKKILLAPWGFYKNWQEANYQLKDKIKKSKSSLPILYETINPDKVVIIIPDTLATINSEKYDELIKTLKEDVTNFIKELNIDMNNLDIIISPGVGSFPNGRFKGKLSDYYSIILYRLSKILPIADDEDVEVHLDVTHGVNYMPVLTYRAIKELLEILAIKNDVRFYVYNSDPYSPDTNLNINIVENVKIHPSSFISPIYSEDKKIIDYLELSGDEKKDISLKLRNDQVIKRFKDIKCNINAFLSSFVYGLPLVYSTFYIDHKEIEDIINKYLDLYYLKIVVDKNNKVVERKIGFNEGFNSLIKAYFISKVCKIDKLIKNELSLDEIRELKERLFRNNRLLESEINNIYKNSNRETNNWVLLRDLMNELKKSKFEIRNFLAHGGFEKNITEIKVDSNRIYLRYSPNYLKEENGIKKLVYDDKNILELLEKTFLEEFGS